MLVARAIFAAISAEDSVSSGAAAACELSAWFKSGLLFELAALLWPTQTIVVTTKISTTFAKTNPLRINDFFNLITRFLYERADVFDNSEEASLFFGFFRSVTEGKKLLIESS